MFVVPSLHYYLFPVLLLHVVATNALAQEETINFESAEIGKPIASWSEKEVSFELANEPRKSKAKGRVMFFPHLGTGHKGILNAMAEEAIPLRITFPKPISKATLTLWGSTTSSALVEAFDHDGNIVAKQELEQVPRRKSPEEQVPFFDLTIESPQIEKIHISGALAGGYVALNKIQFTYAILELSKSKSNSKDAVTGNDQ